MSYYDEHPDYYEGGTDYINCEDLPCGEEVKGWYEECLQAFYFTGDVEKLGDALYQLQYYLRDLPGFNFDENKINWKADSQLMKINSNNT